MSRTYILVGLGLATFAACSEAAHGPSAAVLDSAGVRVVTSVDRIEAARSVSSDPILTLGGPEVEGPTQFGYISNIEFDPAGRIWVSDDLTAELQVFTERGEHVQSLGGTGDGPGEYRAIMLAGLTPDGLMVVSDRRTGRVDWYDQAFEIVRSSTIEGGGGNVVVSPVDDSTLLGMVNTRMMFMGIEDRERIEVSVELVHWVGPDLELVPVGEFPSVDRVSMDRATVPMPLTSSSGFGSYEATFIAGPEAFQVRKYSIGGLEEIFRVDRSVEQVSSALLESLRESAREHSDGDRLRRTLELLERDDLPQTLPTYSQVVVGMDGLVWVLRWAPEPRTNQVWDLFSGSGEYLGPVTLPNGFELAAATSDRVAGVWRDQFDVHHVQVYGLDAR